MLSFKTGEQSNINIKYKVVTSAIDIQSAALAVFGIGGGGQTKLAVRLRQLGHVLQGEVPLVPGGWGGGVRGGGGLLQDHRGWDQGGPPGGDQRGPAPSERGHCGRP